ncbi:MAG: bifunctional phosphoglucose/phosphomannose isomerase [Chloroflexi bacterium]|nr:MAG: bifunctional phosphoglucose/phosphomannose isomerase [Chloroflexota bacterium]MBL1196786.1 bifunctional phosphoglucose/phosphomannose isomerase [Chloroflexota bacterium]NOH14080.1 bifunctional phosphoglucose/phosphomannose isomerase [Chloroflexota bacterium]
MDLNDLAHIKALDAEDMIGHINDLPDQLQRAWELGQELELPQWEGIRQVIVAGMGGSAIGADLLASYAQSLSSVPIFVHRDYEVPMWGQGEETLVICSSHSGNTEEVLSAFEMAVEQGCRVLTVSTGGKLLEAAQANQATPWVFDHKGQPRTAVGYSFGLLLAALTRLGLLPDPSAEVADAIKAMKEQQTAFVPEVPDTGNPTKRMAGQFVGRWITIYGAGILGPVARRWKTQINELSKTQASFEILPEADHNTLQGVVNPEPQFGKSMTIFLRAAHNHPRNQLRDEFTRMGIMLEGQNTDFVMATGETRLANMWTSLHYGDYASFYLAIAYNVDPTPVAMLAELKDKMASAS